ncbi:MAG: AI-2E family transporter [Gammaproteobacteria bacterium]|nr:AI-2E family transporter [Gammaproteobacteria bacterium]
MSGLFANWFRRKFSNPQAVVLGMLLIFGFAIVLTLGDILNPLFIAIVFAYLLEWVASAINNKGCPKGIAVLSVFTGFIALLLTTVFVFIPLIWKQVNEIPKILEKGKEKLIQLSKEYPDFISEQQITDLIASVSDIGGLGQAVLSASVNSLISVMALLIYLFIVPLLVFFLMKDKQIILDWCKLWLPKDRNMADRVWAEVNIQIGNYVRGKIAEILIVGAVTYIAFAYMGLNYAFLLSVLVGFSVLIPYIGAAVVTIPIALIGYFQWGFETPLWTLLITHGIIQALDGNLLVPILFSEAVNLHPVAIISAVLLFGGIWGFWGVFFAIPLATLVNAVMSAWQENSTEDHNISEA